MSAKSFLSKLKWNSKIAESDENMFTELKPAVLFLSDDFNRSNVSMCI